MLAPREALVGIDIEKTGTPHLPSWVQPGARLPIEYNNWHCFCFVLFETEFQAGMQWRYLSLPESPVFKRFSCLSLLSS